MQRRLRKHIVAVARRTFCIGVSGTRRAWATSPICATKPLSTLRRNIRSSSSNSMISLALCSQRTDSPAEAELASAGAPEEVVAIVGPQLREL